MSKSPPSSQLSFGRLLVLLKNYRQVILLGSFFCGLLTFVTGLFEIPYYVSTSRLQAQVMNMGKMMDPRAALVSDFADDNVRLNNMLLVFQSEAFFDALAKELQQNPNAGKLVLTWGIGKRLAVNYALFRMGLAKIDFDSVDPKSLGPRELSALLAPMIQASVNFSDLSIDLRVTALEPNSAYYINQSVMNAFANATSELSKKEIERALGYYNSQLEVARERVDKADADVGEFLKNRPGMASEVSINSGLNDYTSLVHKRIVLENSIEASEEFKNYLRSRANVAMKRGGGGRELLERMRRELSQLKYTRLKLKQQGYSEREPGFLGLTEKISKMEKFVAEESVQLARDGDGGMNGADYQSKLEERISVLQNKILEDKYELKGVEGTLDALKREVSQIPAGEISLGSLKREAAIAAEIYGELRRRAELIKVRDVGDKGGLRELKDPSRPGSPVNMFSGKRAIFAFFIGIASAMSLILIREIFSPRVYEEQDLEGSSFKFAGHLRATLGSRTEILAALDGDAEEDVPVLLCVSPTTGVGLWDFIVLAAHTAIQGNRTLVIHLGGEKDSVESAACTAHGVAYEPMDAWISREEFKGVIQISVKSYDYVLIFVENGTKSPAYSVAQAFSNRMFLMGEIAVHTLEQFEDLAEGFLRKDAVYVALLPHSGRYEVNIAKELKSLPASKKKKTFWDAA